MLVILLNDRGLAGVPTDNQFVTLSREQFVVVQGVEPRAVDVYTRRETGYGLACFCVPYLFIVMAKNILFLLMSFTD